MSAWLAFVRFPHDIFMRLVSVALLAHIKLKQIRIAITFDYYHWYRSIHYGFFEEIPVHDSGFGSMLVSRSIFFYLFFLKIEKSDCPTWRNSILSRHIA